VNERDGIVSFRFVSFRLVVVVVVVVVVGEN